jgi:hypothetical protein
MLWLTLCISITNGSEAVECALIRPMETEQIRMRLTNSPAFYWMLLKGAVHLHRWPGSPPPAHPQREALALLLRIFSMTNKELECSPDGSAMRIRTRHGSVFLSGHPDQLALWIRRAIHP